MKRLLIIILFLTTCQNSFATEWAWYYIYIQTDYLQGPWIRTDILDKSGSYNYLHPKQFEELFGLSGREDLAKAILNHLQKETPERYKFRCTLSLLSDTVIIQTKDAISDFDAVKNELTASFTLNNFIAVRITQRDKTTLCQLKDITIPYMDLVFPAHTNVPAVPQILPGPDSAQKDTVSPSIKTVPLANEQSEDKTSIWLIVSVIINLILIVLLVRKRK